MDGLLDRWLMLIRVQAAKAGATVEQVMSRVISVAETLYAEDVQTNQTMGDYGAAAILANQPGYGCSNKSFRRACHISL